MVEATRAFRIFVSSTFDDMVAERDAYTFTHFPPPAGALPAPGGPFPGSGPTLGVSEEASEDQRSLPVCLAEVGRCHNFIVCSWANATVVSAAV